MLQSLLDAYTLLRVENQLIIKGKCKDGRNNIPRGVREKGITVINVLLNFKYQG